MKRLLILGTGGTLSCMNSEFGLTPSLGIRELLDMTELDGIAEVTGEQLFNLDSTNMLPMHWEMLARRIRECYDDFDGFVVIHGTDTMAYAAASAGNPPAAPAASTSAMPSISCASMPA